MLLFLVYHKVQEGAKGDIYSVTPETFVTHLQLVKESGVDIVDPRTLCETSYEHQNGCVFTFDDGTVDHFNVVLPLLRDFSVPGLFYVPTSKINGKGYLSRKQVQLLFAEGHTIGSHTSSHRRLDVLSQTSIKAEVEDSCEIIYDITGELPHHFAPPGGYYNHEVQQTAQQAGYKFFRTMRWGYNRFFKPFQIEVVPMTNMLGSKFVECALHGKEEWLLKFMYLLKNGARAMRPSSVMERLSKLSWTN